MTGMKGFIARSFAVFSAFFLSVAFAWGATLDEGIAAFNRKDHVTALSIFRDLAGKNDPAAQAWMGFMYEFGHGLPRDYTEAAAWYRRATSQGNAFAERSLGVMHAEGRGVVQDDRQALAWFRRAAQQNDADAQVWVGYLYEKGRGVPKDEAQAVAWYRKAAEQGYDLAQKNLGVMYLNGRGIAQDDRQALAWFRKAAEQGHADAQVWLGYMYRNGRGVPKDEAQAVTWYRKAAEQGYVLGEKNLGVMYAEGRGVAQDDRQALAWFRRAAQQNNAEAQVWIGYLYEKGRGVPKDEAQGVAWYRKAAEQGYDLAQKNLGVMYLDGRGIAQDDRQALAWFRKAAEQDYSDAQVWVGYMYESGRGVPKDYAQAFTWYLNAAERGHATGQSNLGIMYEHGRGVPKSLDQAIDWYRKAAAQGYTRAATALKRLTGTDVITVATAETRGPVDADRRDPATSPIAPEPENYHALIIAIEDYKWMRPLQTPLDDAEEFSRLLLEKYGYRREQVKILRNAQRGDITRELGSLRTRLTERDRLLIYYAGHGRVDSATERGYWLPVDAHPDNEANWVSTDDITNFLKAIRAIHVLVIADSCYSGTLTRDDGVGRTRVGGPDEWVARMLGRRSRTALTSGGLEPVQDRGGGKHSVFAKALIDVLRENPRANDMDTLFQQIKRKVVLNANQTPTYADIRFAGHDDGDFILIPK